RARIVGIERARIEHSENIAVSARPYLAVGIEVKVVRTVAGVYENRLFGDRIEISELTMVRPRGFRGAHDSRVVETEVRVVFLPLSSYLRSQPNLARIVEHRVVRVRRVRIGALVRRCSVGSRASER